MRFRDWVMAFALAVVYLGMVLLVFGVFGFAFGVGAW